LFTVIVRACGDILTVKFGCQQIPILFYVLSIKNIFVVQMSV